MKRFVPSHELLPRVMSGEMAAIARLLSRAESGDAECRETLGTVYARAGKSHVIGITGVPGSGKSTLVSVLARRLREAGHKVGIIAIDPSSPYSGGSIMGDRIRMQDLAADEGIYIRSMATRGAQGGMARATLDSVDILDVAGYHTIVIETVGVGQDEVEIANASHTTVVVSAPGLGDEIQAIKAGILDLKQMLMLGMTMETLEQTGRWRPPVIATSALNTEGFAELVAALAGHKAFLDSSPAGAARLRRIAEFRMLKTAEDLLRLRFKANSAGRKSHLAARLAARQISPYSAGEQLLDGSFKEVAP